MRKKRSLLSKLRYSIILLVLGIIIGISLGIYNEIKCKCNSFPVIIGFFATVGLAIGLFIDLVMNIIHRRKFYKIEKERLYKSLPADIQSYLKQLIRSIRYRKKVRWDVQAELISHFQDEIADCQSEEQKIQVCKNLIEEFGDAKVLGKLTRRAKKRCRPWWKKAIIKSFQAVGIFIVLFILYVAWFLSGKPKIDTDYLAEYNQWIRPVADESFNAAPYYDKAVEKLGEIDRETKNLLSKDFDDANDLEVEKIAVWLADNNEVFELIENGAEKPYFWKTVTTNDPNQPNRLLGILMPHLSEYRTIAFGLSWRGYIKAKQGNFNTAFKNIKISYILGRHNKGNKTIVENLVGLSIQAKSIYTFRDILSNFEIPAEYLTRWQDDFNEMIEDEIFIAQGFMGDRMMMYDEIQRCYVESWFGPDHINLKGVMLLERYCGNDLDDLSDMWFEYAKRAFTGLFFINHPDKQKAFAQADEYYDLWEEYAKKTPAQVKRENINIDKEAEKITSQNILLNLLAPAIDKVIQIHYRAKVDIESVVPLMAILRYKADSGVYPESLQVLVDQGYLDEIPIDPFSDEPIKYRKNDGDFVLYCVGLNMVDDGGVLGIKSVGQKKTVKTTWADNGDAVFWPVE